MTFSSPAAARLFAATAGALLSALAQAAPVQVTVTTENLAPINSITFARLHVGFHSGSFDVFNAGSPASEAIISVAEGGVGTAWQAALAAADPGATRGEVAGPLFPGAVNSASFIVDPTLNPFFTFASMVVPSNDFFIGNDSPTRYRLFDDAGNLLISSISQQADDIWDAGSELFDPAAAAFVGTNDLRTPQGGTVAFNFSELAGFNGLTTAAGYVFDSQLGAATEVYRISFSVSAVPEPQAYALMGLGLAAVGWMARRRAGVRA